MCDQCENFKPKEVRICRTCKYNHLDHYCSRKEGCCGADFLGWEPVEPKEERECKTCNHGSWNNPTKTYCIKACINFSLWEPVEPKVPTCEACRHFRESLGLCSTDRGTIDPYLSRNDENFCGSSRRWFEPERRMAERRGIKMSIASMDDLEKKVTALAEFLQVEFKGFVAIKKEEKPKEIHDCKKCKNFPDNQPAGGAYAYCRYLVECLEKDNRFEPKEIVTKCQKCR